LAGDNKKICNKNCDTGTHMCGTRIKNEVEIYATNLANKTKYMSINAKKWKIFL
jgi:hypothetical protein